MITLEISEGYRSLVDSLIIIDAAKVALRHQSASPDSDMTIVITDDDQLRQLNREFRDIDAPTDVLSFPTDFTDPETEAPYLGDIVISYPRAERQAAAGGHSTMTELQLLVTHGVLHLLGHDHAETKEKKEMWRAQKEILGQLGLENIPIVGEE